MNSWRTVLAWEVEPEYTGAEMKRQARPGETWEILTNRGYQYVIKISRIDSHGVYSRDWRIGNEFSVDEPITHGSGQGLWPWTEIVKARQLKAASTTSGLRWEVVPEYTEVALPSGGSKLYVDFTSGLYYNVGQTPETQTDRLVRRANGQWWFLNRGMTGWKHVGSYDAGKEHEKDLERAYQAWLKKGKAGTTASLEFLAWAEPYKQGDSVLFEDSEGKRRKGTIEGVIPYGEVRAEGAVPILIRVPDSAGGWAEWVHPDAIVKKFASLQLLAWDVDEASDEDAEVPEQFTPVDPIDQRIYAIPDENQRKKAIADRIDELIRQDDPSLLGFTAPYSETAIGHVPLRARSQEEAQIMLDFGSWEDSETDDYEGFEISGPPEPR